MHSTLPPIASNPPPVPPMNPPHASGPALLLPIDETFALCPYRIAALVVTFVIGLTMGNSSAHHARDKLERGPIVASQPVKCTPIIETIAYCPPRHIPETSPHAEQFLSGPNVTGDAPRKGKPTFSRKGDPK